ncbi:MAG: ferredoxin-NADP reductase [Elusimicrobia bacterium CG1_02_37_114]|nr:MAG: ferredoxin-NADP reductase [Elusimicrobia bacterium CG1_02_37_114]PIV53164.1 MAG: ferredoxin-NADP reductase [Elusimicrobia bacterium CG02_land_8_20_14_3_00_37_13]PIZ13918.1 MAG: ferredoxin-NADP reductase [Elusimicrobia bacterium CG_4_10_14_0_8_um_filter_37_32]
MFKILEKQTVAEKINRFVIEVKDIALKALPGQFVIFRVDEKGERIPITISDADKENGTITVFVQEVGKTTEKLGLLKKGDFLRDVAGPLGVPTDIENFGTAVCVAGGVGTAEIYPIARELKRVGNKTINIVGARSKNHLILADEMKKISDELYITTDDGSYPSGRKGFVSDVLKEIMEKTKIDIVFAVGPVIMMKVISEITKDKKIKTIVSLNPIMVDGTGMCGCCRVSVGGTPKFTCVDGPDFDAHQVDWNELILRLKTFNDKERISLEEFHKCRII